MRFSALLERRFRRERTMFYGLNLTAAESERVSREVSK
jgi:hypothetical protein